MCFWAHPVRANGRKNVMRVVKNFFAAIIALVIVAALAIFAAQNLTPLPVRYLGATFTANLWWLVLGGAALGFILALVLVAPGAWLSSWRARRENRQMSQEVESLRRQHTQLRAERDRLQTERDGLRVERNNMRAEREYAQRPAPAATPLDTPAYSAYNTSGASSDTASTPPDASNTPVERTMPIAAAPAAQQDQQGQQGEVTVADTRRQSTQQTQSGGGPFRVFRRQHERPNEEDIWNGQRPPAPTA